MKNSAIALVLAAAAAPGGDALAQNYPAKAVRVVVPITPGSGLDVIGRVVSQKLSEYWSQPVVVENRPGASGTVGTALVAKAPPDGYSLLVTGANGHALNPVLYPNLPYDTWKDFVEIAPLAALYQALVVAPSAGVKGVPELVAAAKARPGQLTFASAGTGTQMAAEKFRLALGLDVVHVPYKGGPEAMTDVMTGRVTYWMPSIGTALPFIQGGRLVALGVSSPQRSSALPDVPTIAEVGVAGFEDALWFGIWAPAGVPAVVVDRLAKDVARAVTAPDVREQFRKLVAEPMSMTPAEFARSVRREAESGARIARLAGIKPQ